jgi:hypothetical protein
MEDLNKTRIFVSGGKFIGGVMLLWCALVAYLVRPIQAAQPSSSAPLSTTIQSLYYSAGFDWEVSPKQVRPMEIRIGKGSTDFVAEIWSGRQIQAFCGLTNFAKEGPNVPVALEMECRGAKFDGLASHATLLWRTWLQGYSRKTALRVHVDRYSNPENFRTAPLAARKVAKR